MMKDRVVALSGMGEELFADDVLGLLDHWDNHLPTLRRAARRWAEGDPSLVARSVHVDSLDIQCPYRPRQIFAVGANYRKHVIELIMADPDMRSDESEIAASDAERRAAAERLMDERANNATPYCFSKLPSSLGGPMDPLVIPPDAKKIDWECELAVIIGKPARHVSAAQASQYIAGYAIANDVTARDLVFRRDVKALGTDWVSSKSQPGFTPFGPYLVPAEFVDPRDVIIRLSVNDRVMQNEHSGDMLIPIERQIEYLSSRVQLMPGDVICTGSPAGNGSHHGVFLKPGDHMVASISGLGEQRVDCI
ncbi:fumarylacetoacetate hydrolase family protein [Sphingomonas chungangi]|nr:fumarylacetoacetate hydrolase family protein [Sphingomonas chungangi]